MVTVSAGFWIMAALWILVLPVRWWLSAFGAALIHELFHILGLYLSNGRLLHVAVSAGGAVMEADSPGYLSAFCSVAAGPAGSLFLLLFRQYCPELAVCGLVQGFFNLLPVYPLDGGRLLHLILQQFVPDRADSICKIITLSVFAGAAGCLAILGFSRDLPLLALVLLGILRKSPCMQG